MVKVIFLNKIQHDFNTVLHTMCSETERKFLVKQAAWNAVKTKGVLYTQGYLLREENKTIRVRFVEDDRGYFTVKGKTNGFSRIEYEYSIPLKDAQELLQQFCNAIVVKKRYKITMYGKLWEVDEFLGDNEGLIVAELELKNENETFKWPDWIEREVTDDKRYYNSKLSVNPYKNWKP